MSNALRKVLTAELRKICPDVFYGQARDPAGPFLVYTLDVVAYEDGMQLIEMTVNACDHNTSAERVENMVDELRRRFHKLYHMSDEIQFSAYFTRAVPVAQEDRTALCRQCTVEIHLYERNDFK